MRGGIPQTVKDKQAAYWAPPQSSALASTLVDEMQGMNFHRAQAVAASMAIFQSKTGSDDEDLLSDFIADLMHWARQNNYDFDAALTRGRDHFIAETEGELP